MSSPTVAVPVRVRLRMTPFHGAAGALVAAGTAVASHDSVTAAYIVAGGGITGLVLSQITAEIIRNLRARRTIDHHAELATEQAALIDHLLTELAEERAGRDRAETQLERLRRRRG